MHFDIFGRNVTDKVSNQKTPYYATSNNVCFCITWQNGETRKSHFLLKCCISALPEFNQSLLNVFNLFDSRLTIMLLFDSLNLAVNAFSSGCWGHGLRERKSREPQQLDCDACTMHVYQCAVYLKEKMSSVMCLIASDIC